MMRGERAQKPSEVPLAHTHFKAEGDVEFRAVLYVPSKSPPDFMDSYYQKKNSVKLYVRRVFISDDFEDLIPRCAPALFPPPPPPSLFPDMVAAHVGSIDVLHRQLIERGQGTQQLIKKPLPVQMHVSFLRRKLEIF